MSGPASITWHAFGPGFPALPRFTPTNASDLGPAFAQSLALQNNDPLAAVAWFQRIARVREGLARLDTALMYAEALGSGATLDLRVGQLPRPTQSGERWVALSPTPIAGGRLSMVAHVPAGFDATRPVAGLLVDEFEEVVPSASAVTGLAFHFDEPGARAPHAILLAVSPDDRPTWDLDTLVATLAETMELAKLRAVDPDALEEAGHFLPALYFATNTAGDTVSTDFQRAAGSAAKSP